MDDDLDRSLSLFPRAPPSCRPLLPPPPSAADHRSAAIDASTVDTTLSLRSTAHAYSHHDNNYLLPSTSFAAAASDPVYGYPVHDNNYLYPVYGYPVYAMEVNDDGTLPLIWLLGCSASASEYMAMSPPPIPLPRPPPPYQNINAPFVTLETWWLMTQTAASFPPSYCMHPEASHDFQLVNTESATNLAFIVNSTTTGSSNGSVPDDDNEASSASPSKKPQPTAAQ